MHWEIKFITSKGSNKFNWQETEFPLISSLFLAIKMKTKTQHSNRKKLFKRVRIIQIELWLYANNTLW